MRDAAVYLLAATLRNRARRTLRQLRSPRYAVALLLGLAYLALVLFGQQHRSGGPFSGPAVEIGGTALLLVLVAKWWLFGADRSALAFSPAEVQFLFPAPVSRTALLGYKLARSQLLILVNALIWTLLLRRGAPGTPGPVFQAVNLWLAFSTVSMHRLGVALTRQGALEHGRAGLARMALPLGLLVAAVVAAWVTVAGLEPGSFRDAPLAAFRQARDTAPLSWVLWPFRLPLLPFAARSLVEWLPLVATATVVLALHIVWVLRADRAFEDAALAASALRAERLRRLSGGHSISDPPAAHRRWFPLAPAGNPAWAIVWKNLTRLARHTSPGLLATAVLGGMTALVLGLAERESSPFILTMVGTLALSWCGILALIGPLWVRADLRGDLSMLALLRTWPLPGQVVMAGQVLSSALVLTALEAVLAGVGLVAIAGIDGTVPPPILVLAGLPVALAVLLGVNVLAVGIQNAAALLYPSWVSTELRPGGIEAVGQQMLTAGVSLLLLTILLAGPATLVGGALYLSADLLGAWAPLPALLLGAVGVGLEVWLLLDWLGERFERSDPSLG